MILNFQSGRSRRQCLLHYILNKPEATIHGVLIAIRSSQTTGRTMTLIQIRMSKGFDRTTKDTYKYSCYCKVLRYNGTRPDISSRYASYNLQMRDLIRFAAIDAPQRHKASAIDGDRMLAIRDSRLVVKAEWQPLSNRIRRYRRNFEKATERKEPLA